MTGRVREGREEERVRKREREGENGGSVQSTYRSRINQTPTAYIVHVLDLDMYMYRKPNELASPRDYVIPSGSIPALFCQSSELHPTNTGRMIEKSSPYNTHSLGTLLYNTHNHMHTPSMGCVY